MGNNEPRNKQTKKKIKNLKKRKEKKKRKTLGSGTIEFQS
jgi:hypothetical protein